MFPFVCLLCSVLFYFILFYFTLCFIRILFVYAQCCLPCAMNLFGVQLLITGWYEHFCYSCIITTTKYYALSASSMCLCIWSVDLKIWSTFARAHFSECIHTNIRFLFKYYSLFHFFPLPYFDHVIHLLHLFLHLTILPSFMSDIYNNNLQKIVYTRAYFKVFLFYISHCCVLLCSIPNQSEAFVSYYTHK